VAGVHDINWRECIRNVIAGKPSEFIPAVFRLDKWHQARAHDNSLPNELEGMSVAQMEAHLGLARSARAGRVFDTVLKPPVECIESRQDDRLTTEWHTPVGTLRMVRQLKPGDEAAGLSPTIIEHPIKQLQDYAAYEQVMAHTDFVPTYDQYLEYDKAIDNAGLPLVVIGPIPFHDLLIRWVGYERAYVHLFEQPDVVLQAVETANNAYQRMWRIVAESPAELVMHGVNFDSQMTSPSIFREHFLPYLSAFNDRMHASGKKAAFHGDGDMAALLDLVVEAGYDVCDCFACEPLVRCTAAQAYAAWKDRITIWGGVPSGLLEPNVPLERLHEHLGSLYRQVAPGDRFILGISDQAMPTATWDHLAKLSEWARSHLRYPIDF